MTLQCTWALWTLSNNTARKITRYYYAYASSSGMEPPQNPKVVAAIKTIYTDNVFVLKIEKEVTEILQSVGVQQGNNMAPVLFLFLVTAFAETHEIVWKYQEILILSVMTASDKTLVDGRICSRTPAMFTPKEAYFI